MISSHHLNTNNPPPRHHLQPPPPLYRIEEPRAHKPSNPHQKPPQLPKNNSADATTIKPAGGQKIEHEKHITKKQRKKNENSKEQNTNMQSINILL
jgi:hypothetical protein